MNHVARRLAILRCAAFATWLIAIPASAEATHPSRTVLVLARGDDDVELDVVTDSEKFAAGVLKKHGGYDVISENDARKFVPEDGAACLRDEACVAGLARKAHADAALVANVSRSGRGYALAVTLIDAAGGLTQHHAESMKKRQSLEANIELCAKAVLGWLDPAAVAATKVEPGRVAPGTMEIVGAPKVTVTPPPAIAPGTMQIVAASKPPAAEPTAKPAPSAAPAIASPAPAAGRKRVMVLDLVATGVDAKTAAPLAEFVAQAVSQHGGYDVASADDVRRMMSQQADKESVGCTKDEACLVEISKKLQADFIVNGSVGQIGSSFVVNLALMSPKEMSKASGASETVSRLEDLPKAVTNCTAKIFKWTTDAPKTQAYHLPKGKKMSFAIMDLKPTGISISSAQNLTQVLSVEVKGVEGASVIGREDIAAMLQLSAAKIQVGCGDDSCMSEIGGALGVDRLVAGDVGKIGESFIVNLRLIDVRHGEVENRVTESYRGDEDQLLRAVRHSGRELLGLSVEGDGKMAVTASQNGAAVFVDNQKRGVTPIPIDGLKVGRHDVRVAHDGWFDWHSEVYVDPLETTSVWALLKERPEAWYQKWWIWTIAGAAVAGGTTAAVVASRPPSTTSHGQVNIQ